MVELLMEVEERFGIRIADAHVGSIRTAGDLYRYVLDRVQRFEQGKCRSAVVFYRLRVALTEVFGIDRVLIRPATPLAELLGTAPTHGSWSRLQDHLEFNLPQLHAPKWRGPVLSAGWMVAVLGAIVGFGRSFAAGWALLLGGLLSVVYVNHRVRALARLPDSCSTIRDLVGRILVEMPVAAKADPWEVWEAVRDIISGITGVPRASISSDSRLVEVLGSG